jgi:phosphatidylglycerol:prolipoprotein diacylglycerol transferase
MLPVLFEIGPFTIYSFGFFLALAYFLGTFVLWREGRKQGYNEEKLLDLSIIGLIVSLIGGRLYFVLLHRELFVEDPTRILFFWQGGFAFHGSLILVIVICGLAVRAWKWSFFQLADIGALAATTALVVGRIGSFLAGVDFGKATELPWGVTLPSVVGSRHPIQLYEAAAYLLLLFFLYLIYFRNLSSQNLKSGKVFFAFLILGSLIRAALEPLRADTSIILGWPISSLVSLLIAIISVLALYYFRVRDFRSDTRGFLRAFFGLNSQVLRRLGLYR